MDTDTIRNQPYAHLDRRTLHTSNQGTSYCYWWHKCKHNNFATRHTLKFHVTSLKDVKGYTHVRVDLLWLKTSWINMESHFYTWILNCKWYTFMEWHCWLHFPKTLIEIVKLTLCYFWKVYWIIIYIIYHVVTELQIEIIGFDVLILTLSNLNE